MYKLAVFDMDGTLLNSNKEISKENLKALDYLKEKRIRIVIATGRPGELLKKYTNELMIDEFVVSCNGSVIAYPFKDEVLHENTIDKETVIKVVDMCEENNYGYLLYTNGAVVSKNNSRLRIYKKMFSASNKSYNPNLVELKDAADIKHNYSPNKILLTEDNPERFKEMVKKISKFKTIEYAQSWEGALDLSPIGDTKGRAVAKLCEYYGFKKDEVMAFGDNHNDISMIEYAGMGVAMGNAEDIVKQAANFVTFSNDEDGIAHAIYKFVK
jgi:Cof subfamily protein (haloacid dehalogenase superfamily)